ncbi:IS3 family transposase [Collinsella aerofaciens]|uniref:IS3 family transposase n=1 Tax=Collinsella aerofaciens TaxID=74426 RepID=UPI00319D9E3E
MSGATAAAAAHAASKGRNGSRKIKASPGRSGVTVSRRRVCRIMRENGLAGTYGRKRFKVHPGAVNVADVPNVVARGFGGRAPRTHICSDLASVRVGASWNYVCLLVDLCNGEIVGHSAGPRRDARAPSQALGLRALVQQLQDPLDTGLHVAGRVQGGGTAPPGIVQIGVANP